MFDRDLLVVDVETTGLDPTIHQVIEIGAVWLDKRTLECKGMFEKLVKLVPWKRGYIEHRAMEKNRISFSELESEGLDINEALREFEDSLRFKEIWLAGWNVCFDSRFLKELYETAQRTWPFDYHVLDIWSLAIAKFPKDKIKELVPIEDHKAHRGLYDALWASEVLRKVVL